MSAAQSPVWPVAAWTATRAIGVVCVAGCLWWAAYIAARSLQPYPLDAFEEYELRKAVHWAEGGGLYGDPANEPLPEAYPPLYFWILGLWTKLVGVGFVSQRLISLGALAGLVACGSLCLKDSSGPRVGVLAFVAALAGFHSLTGKSYEVGKPDALLALFVACAAAAGEHRSWREVIVSSAAIWLAAMTKQNGPLFLAPLCLAHALGGRWRWAVAWGAAMSVAIGGSYLAINMATRGNFCHWVLVWTAMHGVDWLAGLEATAGVVLRRGPALVGILAGSLWLRPRCRWTLCLVTALGVAWMGMSKAGGRENHLLPAAFFGAILLGRWAGAFWPTVARAAAWSGGGHSHTRRWGVLAAIVFVLYPGLPARRDFRWLNRRADEVGDWTAAVRELRGRVAVSHHEVLADRAGAECFFSDLILEFPGLVVPAAISDRIRSREFDWLVLTDDPRTSTTAGWAALIAENYRPAGLLNYVNRSDLLPRRLYTLRGN